MKKITIIKICWFACVMISAPLVFSITAATDSTSSTRVKKKVNYLIVPILFIEPETGFGFGGNASCYYTFTHAKYPSMLNLEISGTQHKQFIGTFNAELYPGKGLWYSSLESKVQKYPDVFYGIGNCTKESANEGLTRHLTEATLTGQHYFGDNTRIGGSVWLNRERISDLEQNGLLKTYPIPGTREYSFLAFGPRLTLDTRNSIYLTRSGCYTDALLLGTFSGLSSNYSFAKLKVDFRYYFPIANTQSLGIQTVISAVKGTLPFQLLPGIGEVVRGYAKTRYCDRNLFAFQTEYSFQIWKKLRGGVFGGMGDVFNHVSDISADKLKMAAGAGLRYVFTPDGVSIRADYAVSRHDGGQFYLTAKDAF